VISEEELNIDEDTTKKVRTIIEDMEKKIIDLSPYDL
jgi:hypothetical protein